MRVLLVINAKDLAGKLAALNPKLEYCAIVVDGVEVAKKTLADLGLSQDLLYPMSELKMCAERANFDYVVSVQKHFYDKIIGYDLQKYGVPQNKIMSFAELHSVVNFKTELVLRYYQEHVQNFEMLATGISTVAYGLDVTRFKRKLFNFARPSQDLYYDFNIAKRAVLYGGGHNKLRYALIGLAPYSFHYDLSLVPNYRGLLLPYVIAFNDLRNFFMPIDIYKNFLREEWLNNKLPLELFDEKRPYGSAELKKSMDQQAIAFRTDTWKEKYYPETRDENIKILDDYLTLCETNNIRPVMFMVPVTEKYMANFNKQLLEEFCVLVEQACQKHPSAVFFDGWKLKDFTYADFNDHQHVNIYGAAKFSAHLNDFIGELEFNHYKDLNNFHNHLNDSIGELDFCNHL